VISVLAVFSAGIGIGCLLLTAIVGGYGYYQSSARIVPGVFLGDTHLGGMSPEEAELTLDRAWNLEKQILVTNGEQNQILTPAELGLRLDVQETVQKAHNVAHGGSILSETAQMFASIKDNWQIEPVVVLNAETAQTMLQTVAIEMGRPPVNASLRLEGNELIPVPYELGYTINIQETMMLLRADPEAVLVNGVMVVIPQPVLPEVADVSEAIAEGQRLMDSKVSIHAYDPIADQHFRWNVPKKAIGSWLKVTIGEKGSKIDLDEDLVASYLSELSAELEPERYLDAERFGRLLSEAISQGTSLTVNVNYKPTKYVIKDDDTLLKISWKQRIPYWMILDANPDLDPEKILTGAEIIIPAKTDLLPLPVIANKRIILSISQQRLWVYLDNAELAEYVISTGVDRSPTQPGIFQVQTHDLNAYASVWDLYMPHFIGIYEAWPGFMNGIHGLPTLSNGRRLWANILGKPASYGCIILDLDAAEWLYNWAEKGVVVEIKP